jgi:hypothetical protein
MQLYLYMLANSLMGKLLMTSLQLTFVVAKVWSLREFIFIVGNGCH